MPLTDQQLEQRNVLLERYQNDVVFYNLVNSIRAATKDSKVLTRGDWISAVLLAFDYWDETAYDWQGPWRNEVLPVRDRYSHS